MHTHTCMHTNTHIYHTRTHIYIFAPECVCCIKSFTVKKRKYSINSNIKSLAIRDQHHANLIVKTWQNVKTNKTDMQICTWDGKCATATELLLLIVPGAVVLTAPSTVSNICCPVDTNYLAQILRFWKAVYMNLPNAFRTRGSSLVRRNLNALLDSISQMFSYFVDILENILLRSWSYILQVSRKWCPSSMTLQNGHSRSVMGVLTLVYIPRSFSNT